MIKVATIINTHGLKGECKLYLFTNDVSHRFQKGRKLVLDANTSLTVQSFRMQKGFGYAKFEEITSIEQAQDFKQRNLWIRKEDLPQLEDGHYYYFELMHCKVINTQGEKLGEVSDILETGAHITLRVSEGGTSFLVPYVPAFIQSVDIEHKLITIREMDGLR